MNKNVIRIGDVQVPTRLDFKKAFYNLTKTNLEENIQAGIKSRNPIKAEVTGFVEEGLLKTSRDGVCFVLYAESPMKNNTYDNYITTLEIFSHLGPHMIPKDGGISLSLEPLAKVTEIPQYVFEDMIAREYKGYSEEEQQIGLPIYGIPGTNRDIIPATVLVTSYDGKYLSKLLKAFDGEIETDYDLHRTGQSEIKAISKAELDRKRIEALSAL